MSKYDMTEFNKLIEYLEAAHYNYKVEPKFEGSMVTIYDNSGNYEWDVAINKYSYGAKDGLLEAAGKPFNPGFDIDLVAFKGNMTAENIIDIVCGYYELEIYHESAL